jgi:hypothetical protein
MKRFFIPLLCLVSIELAATEIPKKQKFLRLTDSLSKVQSALTERSMLVQGRSMADLIPQPRATYRSPVTAGIFSAVLPGAGEFYAESYWRSALFLAAEVTLWVLYINNSNAGHQGERDFINFADSQAPNGNGLANDGLTKWSAERYADRLSKIYTTAASSPNASAELRAAAAELISPARLEQIRNRDYSFINQFERQALNRNGTTLSHTLPLFADQQYYELIGKYENYAIGWYDYDVSKLSNEFPRASNVLFMYAGMRGDANDNLKSASLYLNLVLLNHAASVIDAIIAAMQYNSNVRARFGIEQDAMTGQPMPQVRVAWSF